MSDTSSSCVRKGTKKDTAYENRPKRKRPLNRHEIEKPEDLNVSASARKLKEKDSNDIEVDPTFGYHLVNFVTVFAAISNVVVCKECHSNVRFTESSKRGLGFKIVISCDNCDKKEIPNSPFIKNAYEINRRIILAMRLLGIGLQGIRKFCAFMELPRPVFQSVYDTIIDNILAASDVVSKNSMSNAVNEEKRISNEKGEKNGITASGDGSNIGTNIATSVFNDGLISVLHIIEVMGMKIGPNSYNLCVEVDEKRIKKAEKSISDGAKQARLDLKSMRKEKEELEWI